MRNSAQHAAQDETESGEDDDGLDDDMTDKISSSPSIGDDGGFTIPQLPWPSRVTPNAPPEKRATHFPGPPSDAFSSSPFSETPDHFPLSISLNEKQITPSKVHHQKGEYAMNQGTLLDVDESKAEDRDRLSLSICDQRFDHNKIDSDDAQESYNEGSLDPDDFHHLLLPDNDPLLDSTFDNAQEEEAASATSSPASKASWDDNSMDGTDDDDDDDTSDISYSDDSRFVDSGWGGECLRETEDIDFEFVYALHTFVATVEGQANATKGDTMVLLDDSNSYWWLVRVVKDSSIGVYYHYLEPCVC